MDFMSSLDKLISFKGVTPGPPFPICIWGLLNFRYYEFRTWTITWMVLLTKLWIEWKILIWIRDTIRAAKSPKVPSALFPYPWISPSLTWSHFLTLDPWVGEGALGTWGLFVHIVPLIVFISGIFSLSLSLSVRVYIINFINHIRYVFSHHGLCGSRFHHRSRCSYKDHH